MRPPGKARRPRISGIFKGGTTQPGGMQCRPNAAGLAPRAASSPTSRFSTNGASSPMWMIGTTAMTGDWTAGTETTGMTRSSSRSCRSFRPRLGCLGCLRSSRSRPGCLRFSRRLPGFLRSSRLRSCHPRVVVDVEAAPLELDRGRGHELVDRAATLRAGVLERVGKLLDLLEAMPAGVALVFVQGHDRNVSLIEQVAFFSQHQLTMEPEWGGALPEQRVVK
jgi:hypothetical protein